MKTPERRRDAHKRGFTLLELIVVITLIGLLGTIVAVRVVPVLLRSKQTVALHDAQKIVQTAKMVYATTGEWPTCIEDMVGKEEEELTSDITIDVDPIDPWGNDYVYELYGSGPVVMSLGRDNQPGGTGEDEDIIWPASRGRR